MRDSPSILPPIDIRVSKNKDARAFQIKEEEYQGIDKYSIEKSDRPRFNDALPLYQKYLKKQRVGGKLLSLIESSILSLKDANVSFPQLRELDLSGLDLNGLNLSGADLRGAKLTDAQLIRANLTNAILRRVNLTNANLSEANLTNANLTNAILIKANLTNTNLSGVNLKDSFLE